MAAPHAPGVVHDDVVNKIYKYPSMCKTFKSGFKLNVVEGEFTDSQIILLRGLPHTGKTTFINMLAGFVIPDKVEGEEPNFVVSYKPQHITRYNPLTVRGVFPTLCCSAYRNPRFVATVIRPLKIEPLMDRLMKDLSDNELQRVGLCFCLSRVADIYLIDEPTAKLDSVQRRVASQVIKRFIKRTKKTAFVIEHNQLEVASYLQPDRVIVFEGTPSVDCVANPPIDYNESIPI